MSMLSVHEDALAGQGALYHEFLARYSKQSKVVYGFVEGKDDLCYYQGFVEQMLPDGWEVELWPAGNKRDVYRIHKALDWRRFPKKRVCFFVDSDLSELIPERLVADINIYVTDAYSIENSIVRWGTCRRVLTEICGFSNVDHDELDEVKNLFEEQLENFLKAMIPIMAWILAWRRSQKNTNLNEIDMKNLFSFSNGQLQSKPRPKRYLSPVRYIHAACGLELDPLVDVASLESELSKGKAYRRFTRGKYVFWFLVEFCLSVRKNPSVFFKSVQRTPKMNVSLSWKNGMTIVGNKSRLPQSLRKFLDKTFWSYVQQGPLND